MTIAFEVAADDGNAGWPRLTGELLQQRLSRAQLARLFVYRFESSGERANGRAGIRGDEPASQGSQQRLPTCQAS